MPIENNRAASVIIYGDSKLGRRGLDKELDLVVKHTAWHPLACNVFLLT